MHYFPQHPLRPLDWRWVNACQGVPRNWRKHYHPTPLEVDLTAWVKRRGTDPATWREPKGLLTGLRQAIRLERDGGTIRDELRARILADEAPASIAQCFDTTLAVIELFHQVFFDFGPRQAIDAIQHRALRMGDWMARQPTEGEIWMHVALSGGPHILDILLAERHGWAEPAYPDRPLMAQLLREDVLAHAETMRFPQVLEHARVQAEGLTAWARGRSIDLDVGAQASIMVVKLAHKSQVKAHQHNSNTKSDGTPTSPAEADELSRQYSYERNRI